MHETNSGWGLVLVICLSEPWSKVGVFLTGAVRRIITLTTEITGLESMLEGKH